MRVKHAIILSAGKGTRMGPLGKVLAKPMWPFFGKELIQSQINFLKYYGIEKFYINSHHLHEQLAHLESEDVKVIYEPILLDQGGGVLNILKQYKLWDLPILINNADQFYFISPEEMEEGLKKLELNDVVLFGLEVEKDDGYNALVVDDKGALKEIVPNANLEKGNYQTYSGMGLLKCDAIEYENQSLSFFESVANFKKKRVVLQRVKSLEYYDLGKLESYYNLCMKVNDIFKGDGSPRFKNFFQKYLNMSLSKKGEGLNFSSDPSRTPKKGQILLDEGIIYKEGETVLSELDIKK